MRQSQTYLQLVVCPRVPQRHGAKVCKATFFWLCSY